ncbi:hypothetical protein [Collimonas silvisoli]|uniref:hypothetical protein n=1 Tax=Collimonas silvisoli TaxID=2825884 RepID=UPI001B8DA217|nr:hypothetical protein [Collimonas silvisoli]
METLPKVRRITKGTTSRPSGVRLMPAELAEVDQYALAQERSRAWFLRSLILRGLADYKRELASHQ